MEEDQKSDEKPEQIAEPDTTVPESSSSSQNDNAKSEDSPSEKEKEKEVGESEVRMDGEFAQV